MRALQRLSRPQRTVHVPQHGVDLGAQRRALAPGFEKAGQPALHVVEDAVNARAALEDADRAHGRPNDGRLERVSDRDGHEAAKVTRETAHAGRVLGAGLRVGGRGGRQDDHEDEEPVPRISAHGQVGPIVEPARPLQARRRVVHGRDDVAVDAEGNPVVDLKDGNVRAAHGQGSFPEGLAVLSVAGAPCSSSSINSVRFCASSILWSACARTASVCTYVRAMTIALAAPNPTETTQVTRLPSRRATDAMTIPISAASCARSYHSADSVWALILSS